jgi:hypothetical protein
MKNGPLAVARACLQAYVEKDRAAIEALIAGGPERMGAPRLVLLSERFQSYRRSMRRHHLGSRTVLFRCANLESGRSTAGYRRIT